MISRLSLCAAALLSLCLAACSSNPDRDAKRLRDKDKQNLQLSESELRQEADLLYRDARKSLDSASYTEAIAKYDRLIARYPFSDYGTQGELERIFAQYKGYQSDEAAASADRFLRDHPRHPKADYVQYLKGLIDFDRNNSVMSYLPIDSSRSDVSSEKLAFNDFALLAQKYPSSRYLGDARKRMIYLRDRIAQHELSVVRYYQRRGAYLAAAKRAEAIVSDFPGAPATGTALQLMEESYRAMGLNREADEARKLLAANPGLLKPGHENAAPTRVVLTDLETPAPKPASAAPQASAAQKQTGGFFSWFAGLFSRFDTTRPENTYVLTIPTGDAASSSAGGSTSAGTPSDGSAPAATVGGTRLRASVGPEDSERWKPADAPASTPTPAKPAADSPPPAPAKDSGSKPADQAPPAPTEPAKKGLLGRIADGVKGIFAHDAESVDPPAAK